jgi:hypothetical protein
VEWVWEPAAGDLEVDLDLDAPLLARKHAVVLPLRLAALPTPAATPHTQGAMSRAGLLSQDNTTVASRIDRATGTDHFRRPSRVSLRWIY